MARVCTVSQLFLHELDEMTRVPSFPQEILAGNIRGSSFLNSDEIYREKIIFYKYLFYKYLSSASKIDLRSFIVLHNEILFIFFSIYLKSFARKKLLNLQ